MSQETMLLVISLMVMLGVIFLKPQNFMKGKLFTMPLRKRFPKMFDHAFGRLFQIWILYFAYLVAHSGFHWPEHIVGTIYLVSFIAIYLDDWFADDDNLKRWMKELRNKIKWKMELPVPEPAGSKVRS